MGRLPSAQLLQRVCEVDDFDFDLPSPFMPSFKRKKFSSRCEILVWMQNIILLFWWILVHH